MNTIIEITYTNYTESIIVNAENVKEVISLINNDSDVVSFDVSIQGDFDFYGSIKQGVNAKRFLNANDEVFNRVGKLDQWELSGWQRRDEIKSVNKLITKLNNYAKKIKFAEYYMFVEPITCLEWSAFRSCADSGWEQKYEA